MELFRKIWLSVCFEYYISSCIIRAFCIILLLYFIFSFVNNLYIFFSPSSFYLNSSYWTYSVELVSGIEFSYSSITYNTQCSSKVPSLIPIIHLTILTHLPLVTINLFSMIESLFYGLLFSPSHSMFFCFVFFFNSTWVKSYSVCLSLTYFA